VGLSKTEVKMVSDGEQSKIVRDGNRKGGKERVIGK
jgi:hypothetical protein